MRVPEDVKQDVLVNQPDPRGSQSSSTPTTHQRAINLGLEFRVWGA